MAVKNKAQIRKQRIREGLCVKCALERCAQDLGIGAKILAGPELCGQCIFESWRRSEEAQHGGPSSS